MVTMVTINLILNEEKLVTKYLDTQKFVVITLKFELCGSSIE